MGIGNAKEEEEEEESHSSAPAQIVPAIPLRTPACDLKIPPLTYEVLLTGGQ